MAATVKCPNPECGKEYRVQEQSLGGRAKCKSCGLTFTLQMSADETLAPKVKASPVATIHPVSGTGRLRQTSTPEESSASSPAASVLGSRASAFEPLPEISPYVIKRQLGAGAMGKVYLAHDLNLDRDVAIKVLPMEFAADQERVDRFLREARLAAKVQHVNTVIIHQIGVEGGLAFIVMELVDGGSLDKAIAPDRPMSWREASQAVRDAAAGLAAAHEIGLVHRDVKPANLMRTSRGGTKVVDFGLARARAGSTQLTQQGTLMGTPAYMAPELWAGESADARSDLYALICSYYQLLAGRVPFDAEELIQVGYQHRYEPFPDPRQLVADLPDAVCRILARGAQKKPEDRYQTAAELITDLDALLASSEESLGYDTSWIELGGATGTVQAGQPGMSDAFAGTVAHDSTVSPTEWASRTKRGPPWRKNPTLALAAAGGAAAVLVFLGWIIIRINKGDQQTVVRAPTGSEVTIGKDGNVDIQLPKATEKPASKTLPNGKPGSGPQGEDAKPNTDGRKKPDATPEQGGKSSPSPSAPQPATPKPQPPVPSPAAPAKLPSTVPAKPSAPGIPPPAIAPPVAASAKQHQENWAKQLDVPLEVANSVGMKLILIPAGEFEMGATPEETASAVEVARNNPASKGGLDRGETPRHRVKITKSFYLGRYQVTQDEYAKVMGANPSAFAAKQMDSSSFNPPLDEQQKAERAKAAIKVAGKDTSRHPVDTVSWEDTVEFCRRLSALPDEQAARRVYRLPSEAEWEYACRAGTTTRWNCGDDMTILGDFAWFQTNAVEMTHPVGEKAPNAWGLYDIHGNLCHWCADWFSADYYKQSPPENPTGPPNGSTRVLRGGNWANGAFFVRSAYRLINVPSARKLNFGFRVLAEIPARAGAAAQDPAAPPPAGTSPAPRQLAPSAKQPAPDDAALAPALKLAQETFKHDYDKADTPAALTDLAKKILQKASEVPNDPAARFVFWRLARDVAVRGGDTKTAFEAIDRMAEAFEVNPWEMKAAILNDAFKQPHKSPERKLLATQALALMNEAMDHDAHAAEQMGKLAVVEGGKARDRETVQQAQAGLKRLKGGSKPASGTRAGPTKPVLTNSIGMQFVLIPAREFLMGSTPAEIAWAQQEGQNEKGDQPEAYFGRLRSEAPKHKVRISRPFYMGVYEVTQGDYERVVGTNPSSFSANGTAARGVAGQNTSRHPVEMVSWQDAMEFCHRLSSLPEELAARRTYRLPTEAEWEYAARAGSTTQWSFGDDPALLGEYAWFNANANATTHPVGQKKPNAWGLYDIYGNVFEWCMDWDGRDYYRQSPPIDPAGPSAGVGHASRGGGWLFGPLRCRSAFRAGLGPSAWTAWGFRVVLAR